MKRLITIETKYLPATNTRGSRIKAWFSHDTTYFKPVTVPHDYSKSFEDVHAVAASALLELHKDVPFVSDLKLIGYSDSEKGYLFVCEHGEQSCNL